ncbi:hypothetical protein NDU88_002417 [Pleurodeles waltl]|uniref:Uncharacterized protein n=1 Tax=Pleurodeles waltl TaxID=8319 RepID=A0AAV7Q711_PLEWA|nr:hypothetical protein NDU88_002417 [Pleurodeles waltl]
MPGAAQRWVGPARRRRSRMWVEAGARLRCQPRGRVRRQTASGTAADPDLGSNGGRQPHTASVWGAAANTDPEARRGGRLRRSKTSFGARSGPHRSRAAGWVTLHLREEV